MNYEIKIYFSITIILFISSLILNFLSYWGNFGQKTFDALCYAPAIDWVLAYLMIAPLIAGMLFDGWKGVGISLAAQLSALWLWIFVHELVNYKSQPKTKIHQVLGRIVGGWRNHLAVWITALAIPLFWLVRLTEIVVYPCLTWLIGLPKYQAKEWVNVSRHKFQGLIGYDLIWCLYCDWMTGVWSLGTEMLRNVESFWCPIRFDEAKKCENCQLDFPDLNNGWIASDGEIEDVVELLNCKYSQVNKRERGWFGHNSR